MKFAVQHNLLQQKNYQKAFRLAKELGFDAVEITQFGSPLDSRQLSEIQQASENNNLPVSALCGGYRGWIGDFEHDNRLMAVEDIKLSLKHMKEVGAQGLIAPAAFGMFSDRLPSSGKPRSDKEDEAALIDSLTRIAEAAEAYQVTLLLEPLNRYEDHMINRVEQAATLIDKVDSPAIKVLGDFFHMNIEELDISATINQYLPYLNYFHLADSNRLQPGRGHIDFGSFLRELENKNYQGYLSLECSVSGEVETSLAESIGYLQQHTKTKGVK